MSLRPLGEKKSREHRVAHGYLFVMLIYYQVNNGPFANPLLWICHHQNLFA